MIQIQPVAFPILGTATQLGLNVLTFAMDAVVAHFYYALLNSSGEKLIDGNISMNEQEFAQWGADNNYCIEWACSKLNLQLI